VAYTQGDGPPEAILYFRIYAGLIAFSGVATMLLGLYFVVDGSLGRSASKSDDLLVMGAMYAVFGAFFSVPYLVGLFAGRRPWVHTLGTVLIVLTMATTCCLPIAILLLIAWIKPEVKRWYETG
jgi:hypothetical protein